MINVMKKNKSGEMAWQLRDWFHWSSLTNTKIFQPVFE